MTESKACRFTHLSTGTWYCPVCKGQVKVEGRHAPVRLCRPRKDGVDLRIGAPARRISTEHVVRVVLIGDKLVRVREHMLPCPHRGEPVDGVLCRICGPDKGELIAVHSCEIHGKCTHGKFKHAPPDMHPYKVCIYCKERPRDE